MQNHPMPQQKTNPSLRSVNECGGVAIRVTGAPTPELQIHVEVLLSRMAIGAAAYLAGAYLVVTATYGQFIAGQTYSVAPGSGFLRIRLAEGEVCLFRRWGCLVALGPGILRGIALAPEARILAIKPEAPRSKRRRYRVEVHIGPVGNRLLRAQLAELKRRPEEAGTA